MVPLIALKNQTQAQIGAGFDFTFALYLFYLIFNSSRNTSVIKQPVYIYKYYISTVQSLLGSA